MGRVLQVRLLLDILYYDESLSSVDTVLDAGSLVSKYFTSAMELMLSVIACLTLLFTTFRTCPSH